MVTADVALLIKVQPTLLEAESTQRTSGPVGGTAEMTCAAKGFPEPKIYWSREDRKPLPSGKDEEEAGTFVIDNIREEDRGEWQTRLSRRTPGKIHVGRYCLMITQT